jgi:hypothetical protein
MESWPAALARFASAASRYCALVEEPVEVRPRNAFIRALRSELAELLAAAFQLPDVPVSVGPVAEAITLARWGQVFGQAQLRVGELVEGPVASVAVADAVADVWRDMRAGLDSLNAGARWQDVAWEWRFGLETHWGRHAVEALAALHDA